MTRKHHGPDNNAELRRPSCLFRHRLCGYCTLREIQELAKSNINQDHLDHGLRAAFARSRPDVAMYLVDRGADWKPLAAFVGVDEAQTFLDKGRRELEQQKIETRPVQVPAAWTTDREYSDLRLQWISLQSRNHTVRAAVEGTGERSETILHLESIHASKTPTARIAWMQFDLARGTDINETVVAGNVSGSPLHFAVDEHGEPWKNAEVLDFLLEHGADPFVKNHWPKQTPREYVDSMLGLPDDCLAPQMRDFYRVASAKLLAAENAFANKDGSHGGSVLARLKAAIGYGAS
jgi:hypothetical protein